LTERLRVAVVGPGFIGQRHLDVLSAEPAAEIVGILGRRIEDAGVAATRFGGRPYDDLDRLLDTERPDVAWICVPPDRHGALELALIERGIDLFVEKPLAADAATPERIAAELDVAGVIAGVAYHWRAMDTLREVEDAIAANPVRLIAGQWLDGLPATRWWRRQAESGGQVVEQATHLVDLSRRLIGEATVLAATADRHPHPGHPDMDVADVSTAVLRYATGPVGMFAATCILGNLASQELRLFAEGLAITVSAVGVRYETAGGRLGAGGGATTRFVPTGNDPIRDEDRAFLDAVRNRDPGRLFSRYDDALRTHRLTVAIREAAGDGG
jgi:predicted dehydrogenase